MQSYLSPANFVKEVIENFLYSPYDTEMFQMVSKLVAFKNIIDQGSLNQL